MTAPAESRTEALPGEMYFPNTATLLGLSTQERRFSSTRRTSGPGEGGIGQAALHHPLGADRLCRAVTPEGAWKIVAFDQAQ